VLTTPPSFIPNSGQTKTKTKLREPKHFQTESLGSLKISG